MLVVSDSGCNLHLPRRLKYFGPEAQVMREVIANLSPDGDGHTYICKLGHSHRLMVEARRLKGSSAGAKEFDSPG